jgi:heme A synthase
VSWRGAHEAFAWVLMGANAVAGGWSLGAHVQDRLRHRSVWWAVIAAQVLVFVQVALGVILMNAEGLEPEDLPDLHLLYGFSAIIAIAILYGYRSTSPWVREREYLVYGLGSLFIMGLGIRELFLV